jgi:RNA polymerase sigma-70 factor (ECF subfamily)
VTELPISLTSADWTPVEADRDLIERAKRDRQAFAVLYRLHYDAIAGHVFRRVGDVHATEDLVAEVFLTAMRYLPRYRHRGVPFRAWLFRIATNTVNRWARRNRGTVVKSLDADVEHEPAAFSLAGDGDRDGDAQQALLSLSPKHQAVLALHYFEGMSVGEVAAVIGCSAGTVKSRLSRARVTLRERLERRR